MKKYLLLITILNTLMLSSCILNNINQHNTDNKELANLFNNYYEERMQLFPLEATQNGDNRYNDKLYPDFTDGYRAKLKEFYTNYLAYINHYDRSQLDDNDKVSFDVFKREMEMSIEGLQFHQNYMEFNQFEGLPLYIGQMASGDGIQPFKTARDYDNWQVRMKAFAVWTDSAIVYFRKGMDTKYVLPKSLVVKMIPQMKDMITDTVEKQLFYTPVTKFPDSIAAADKQRITAEYKETIKNYIIPSYKKLYKFLSKEYLPKARNTSGINDLPDGAAYYKYLVKFWTTTNKTPEEIYQTGLSEVKRIRTEMEKTKDAVGFKGSLKDFFEFVKTDKKLMPYKTPEEIINAFKNIQKTIDPKLKSMFSVVPKTKFEIRQTEAFRAASGSAEYNQGSADGSRPGIFYIPIIDATKFNITSGMESLFLHEAIPGHHYQVSLQQENDKLPKFRRFCWYGAYGEGWALYCESLGKELGLYTNPYQYMGALGDEMLRAVRLVVDVSIHTGKMTREQAIAYMLENLAYNEEDAVSAIERYIAIPAQALSYKIGALKIRELRAKYQTKLGNNFSLSNFHDELLKDGCLPLETIETKMDAWAEKQGNK